MEEKNEEISIESIEKAVKESKTEKSDKKENGREEKTEKKEINEVQGTITPQNTQKANEEEFFSILKMVAPGTNLRASLDGILKIGHGALIVLENPSLIPILDGGFRVNSKFTPQKLMELTKMDGAIILSKDLKRISLANVLLTPDSKIKSSETGTRHKAAERTTKQTSSLVIAISERKNEINLFYKNIKYHLKTTAEVLRKANEHIQILEKQRELFDSNIERLNTLELRNHPNLHQALTVIQKGRLIQKISDDLKRYTIELGSEGILLKTRLKELTTGVEKETNLVIKDYTNLDVKKSKILLESLSYDEILDNQNIISALAYENPPKFVPVKGWRILSKTSLAEADIAKIIKQAQTLGKAVHGNTNEYSSLLGEEKTSLFKQEIDRIKLNTFE